MTQDTNPYGDGGWSSLSRRDALLAIGATTGLGLGTITFLRSGTQAVVASTTVVWEIADVQRETEDGEISDVVINIDNSHLELEWEDFEAPEDVTVDVAVRASDHPENDHISSSAKEYDTILNSQYTVEYVGSGEEHPFTDIFTEAGSSTSIIDETDLTRDDFTPDEDEAERTVELECEVTVTPEDNETAVSETAFFVTVERSDFTPSENFEWNMFGANPANSGALPTQSPSIRACDRWVSEFEHELGDHIVATEDNTIVGTTAGELYQLPTRDGIPQMITGEIETLSGSPAIVGDIVYAPCEDQHVYAIRVDTGEILWSRDMGVELTSPVVDNDTVYISDDTGVVSCLDTADGSLHWTYDTEKTPMADIALHDGTIYVPCAQTIEALNASLTDLTDSERHQWTYDHSELGSITAVSVSEDTAYTIFLPDDDGDVETLVALDTAEDPDSGRVLWEANHSGLNALPALSKDRVYVTTESKILAYTTAGDIDWESNLPNNSSEGPPLAVADGTIYTVDATGVLVGYNAYNGVEQWRRELDDSHTVPIVVNGVVYVGSSNTMYAFESLMWKNRGGKQQTGYLAGQWGPNPKYTDVEWIRNIDTQHAGTPSLYDDKLYCKGNDDIYEVDLETGEFRSIQSTQYTVWARPFIQDGNLYQYIEDNSGLESILNYNLETDSTDWIDNITDSGHQGQGLSYHNGTLYTYCSDNTVKALEIEAEGVSEQWSYEVPEVRANSLVWNTVSIDITGERLYFVNNSGLAIALDIETGEELWQFDSESDYWTAETIIINGILYTGFTNNGILYALDTDPNATDRVIWSFDSGGTEGGPAPVYHDGVIYAPQNGDGNMGKIYALDASEESMSDEERLIWETVISDDYPLGAPPVLLDGILYTGTDNGEVDDGDDVYLNYAYALDAETGDILWDYEVEQRLMAEFAIHNGSAYLPVYNGKLHKVSELPDGTGHRVNAWNTAENRSENGPADGPSVDWTKSFDTVGVPTYDNGNIYFGADGKLYSVAAEDGSEDWVSYADGNVLETTRYQPAIDSKAIYDTVGVQSPPEEETIEYTYTGDIQTHDVSDVNEVEIQLEGAGGSSTDSHGGPHSGGVGGSISCTVDTSDMDTLSVYVGGSGDTPTGGWGYHDGGDGIEDDGGNFSGGGGGSTEIRSDDGSLIAVAEAGGGAGTDPQGNADGAGGGGGARGGNGGSGDDNTLDGYDAEGTGDGGAGGGANEDGNPGGYDVGSAPVSDVDGTVGSAAGADEHGRIEITNTEVEQTEGVNTDSIVALNKELGFELWRTDLDGETTIETGPTVAATDTVLAGSEGGTIYALDTDDGETQWTFDLTDTETLVGTPAVHLIDETVYVVGRDESEGGTIHALTVEDGAERWSTGISSTPHSGPIYFDNTVFVMASDEIIACDAADGSTVWSHAVADVGSVDNRPEPALANDMLFAVTDTGELSALDINDGSSHWSTTVSSEYLYGSPVVANGLVYVGAEDGSLYALTVKDGTLEWSYDVGAAVDMPVLIDNTTAYVVDETGTLTKLIGAAYSPREEDAPDGEWDEANEDGWRAESGNPYGTGNIVNDTAPKGPSDDIAVDWRNDITSGLGGVTTNGSHIFLNNWGADVLRILDVETGDDIVLDSAGDYTFTDVRPPAAPVVYDSGVYFPVQADDGSGEVFGLASFDIDENGDVTSSSFVELTSDYADFEDNGVEISNDIAYVSERSGIIYAIDITANEVIATSEPVDGEITEHSLAVTDDYVVVTSDTIVQVLTTETLEYVWSHELVDLESETKPVIKNGIVYVGEGSFSGADGEDWGRIDAFALDPDVSDSHRLIWSVELDKGVSLASPAIHDGVLYVGTSDNSTNEGTLYALDASIDSMDDAERILWTWDDNGNLNTTRPNPVLVDGVLYTMDGDGDVYAVDTTTEEMSDSDRLLWSYQTAGREFGQCAVADGALYVPSHDGGGVYKFINDGA